MRIKLIALLLRAEISPGQTDMTTGQGVLCFSPVYSGRSSNPVALKKNIDGYRKWTDGWKNTVFTLSLQKPLNKLIFNSDRA